MAAAAAVIPAIPAVAVAVTAVTVALQREESRAEGRGRGSTGTGGIVVVVVVVAVVEVAVVVGVFSELHVCNSGAKGRTISVLVFLCLEDRKACEDLRGKGSAAEFSRK